MFKQFGSVDFGLCPSRREPAPVGDSRRRFLIQTPDGAEIALYQYPCRSSGARPTLLVHGLGTTSMNYDFPDDRSLALHLSRRGIPVWGIELRGVNGYRAREMGEWNIRDYYERDLPTAIDFIRAQSGVSKVNLLGHSFGGTLIYFLLQNQSSAADKIVTVAAPVLRDSRTRFLDICTGLGALLSAMLRVVPQKDIIRLGLWAPKLVYRYLLRFVANPQNVEPSTLTALMRGAVSNLPRQVVRELIRSYWDPSDRRIRFSEISNPALVISCEKDFLAPKPSIAEAFDELSSPQKTLLNLGVREGFGSDYGHADPLLGRTSKDELYPTIAEFLLN